MRIMITGASGLVGTALGKALVLAGHEIVAVSRSPDNAKLACPFPARHISWNEVETGSFPEIDGVVNLAGETVASWPWNAAKKAAILGSRIDAIKALHAGFTRKGAWPQVWVNASAIGFYGDRDDEDLDETSNRGTGFLADVCQAWEGALSSVPPTVRVVRLRLGVVLARHGGALDAMMPAFRMGIGGVLGSGQQWMSWIHIDDVVGLFMAALSQDAWRGVVNGVAPHAVRNRDFTKMLGKVVRRPTFCAVPGFLLKFLGEFSSLFLGSAKVLPRAAIQWGYKFRYTDCREALSQILDFQARWGVYEFYREQWVPRNKAELWPFFCDVYNLERLTPEILNFKVLGMSTPEVGEGTFIDYKLLIRGVPARWRTKILDWQPGEKFVDTQLKGPYALWHHTHEFQEMGGGTLMTDRVLYKLPLWPFSDVMLPLIRADIKKIFAYRRTVVAKLFTI